MANNNLKYLRIAAAQRDVLRKQWNQPLLWPLCWVVLRCWHRAGGCGGC